MYTTRFGRTVKKPERYTPEEENLVDDFKDSDYDEGDQSDVSTEISFESEELSEESDVDENGNLNDFVVEENTEDNNDDQSSEDGECSSRESAA